MSASSAVDNRNQQGIHLRNLKTCPNKPSHFFRATARILFRVENNSILDLIYNVLNRLSSF